MLDPGEQRRLGPLGLGFRELNPLNPINPYPLNA